DRAARALLDMKLGRARATADYDKLKQLAKAMRDGTITQAERDELQRLARQLGGNGFKDLSAADQERLKNDLEGLIKDPKIKPPTGSGGSGSMPEGSGGSSGSGAERPPDEPKTSRAGGDDVGDVDNRDPGPEVHHPP